MMLPIKRRCTASGFTRISVFCMSIARWDFDGAEHLSCHGANSQAFCLVSWQTAKVGEGVRILQAKGGVALRRKLSAVSAWLSLSDERGGYLHRSVSMRVIRCQTIGLAIGLFVAAPAWGQTILISESPTAG